MCAGSHARHNTPSHMDGRVLYVAERMGISFFQTFLLLLRDLSNICPIAYGRRKGKKGHVNYYYYQRVVVVKIINHHQLSCNIVPRYYYILLLVTPKRSVAMYVLATLCKKNVSTYKYNRAYTIHMY